MNNIFQHRIYDNTIGTYLVVLLTILCAYLVRNFLSKNLAAFVLRFFSQSAFQKQNKLYEYVVSPLGLFIFSLTVIIAIGKLTMPQQWNLTFYKDITLHKIFEGIASSILIITFIRLAIRTMLFMAFLLQDRANLTPDKTDNQLIIFFRDFFKVLLNIVGGLLILRFVFNYDISKLVTGLSIVGAAVALATKESLENLIASFIIFFDKPFTVGDFVKVQSFNGTVEKIGLRSTRIRTDHKTFITVPNKQMVDTILDNITLRTQRRGELLLEIDLSTPLSHLQELVAALHQILEEKEAQDILVYLSNTGKQAHIITIEYFYGVDESLSIFLQRKQEINFSVIAALQDRNIKLASVPTTVVIKES